MQWHRDGFTVDDDAARLDLDWLAVRIAATYWAQGRSREAMENAVCHSLNFGLYQGERQVGYARAVSDRTVFTYVADVFIGEAQRGRGLGRFLVSSLMDHPHLRDTRFFLKTRDAHGVYEPLGFRRTECMWTGRVPWEP